MRSLRFKELSQVHRLIFEVSCSSRFICFQIYDAALFKGQKHFSGNFSLTSDVENPSFNRWPLRPLQRWLKFFVELITHKPPIQQRQAQNSKARRKVRKGFLPQLCLVSSWTKGGVSISDARLQDLTSSPVIRWRPCSCRTAGWSTLPQVRQAPGTKLPGTDITINWYHFCMTLEFTSSKTNVIPRSKECEWAE